MMRDPVTDAALDPSCILCITPDRGGSWWSRLRPDTVWPPSAPPGAEGSEPVRLGLLKYTNISTENGFNAADPAQLARVDTALDLRGKVSSYTVVVDCELAETIPYQKKYELAGQGPAICSDTYPAICSIARSSLGNLQLSQEIAGKRAVIYKNMGATAGRYRVAGVVEVGQNSTRLALYLDSELFLEQTFDGIPVGFAAAANYALFDNRSGSYELKYAPIYSCLLFDRALTAGEIAALSQGGS